MQNLICLLVRAAKDITVGTVVSICVFRHFCIRFEGTSPPVGIRHKTSDTLYLNNETTVIEDCTISVSYTHLDVYKRQVICKKLY